MKYRRICIKPSIRGTTNAFRWFSRSSTHTGKPNDCFGECDLDQPFLPDSLAISILVMGSSCGYKTKEDKNVPSQQEIQLEENSDVDCVCVVPFCVTNSEFFAHDDRGVGAALQLLQNVHSLTIVSNATVPIIKFKYGTVDIDLLLLRLKQGVIPAFFDPLNKFNETCCVHPQHIRQYKSVYAYLYLYASFPNGRCRLLYETIKFVKEWARARQVYGTIRVHTRQLCIYPIRTPLWNRACHPSLFDV